MIDCQRRLQWIQYTVWFVVNVTAASRKSLPNGTEFSRLYASPPCDDSWTAALLVNVEGRVRSEPDPSPKVWLSTATIGWECCCDRSIETWEHGVASAFCPRKMPEVNLQDTSLIGRLCLDVQLLPHQRDREFRHSSSWFILNIYRTRRFSPETFSLLTSHSDPLTPSSDGRVGLVLGFPRASGVAEASLRHSLGGRFEYAGCAYRWTIPAL
jgi:hypothetical protein